jgi:DNA polymerase/3'-5' exonuclease PolX
VKQSTLFPQDQIKILPELDLAEAADLANWVKSAVETYCDRIEVAGSIRRQRPKVHDIDFVVTTKTDAEWQKISERLKQLKAKPNCAGNAVIKALIACQNGHFQADFYRAHSSNFGILLLIRTGSAEHNMWLAGLAHSKGMQLKYSQGLLKEGNVIAGENEKGVFEALDLNCPEPQEREISEDKPVWLPTLQTH